MNRVVILLLAMAWLTGCSANLTRPDRDDVGQSPTSEAQEKQALREFLTRYRVAMTNRDQAFVRAHFADSVPVAERGVLFETKKSSILKNFATRQHYKYELVEIEPPRITLAADSGLAWAFLNYKYRVLTKDTEQLVDAANTVSLLVLRKTEAGWQIQAIARTKQGG